ncbi:uncharacterized protein SPPG_05046 [Spizellomyces punctatus DAOM BR117]|uniref:PPM-type phosphatase domain-containing protein n=1 Tax=Spizellomyces punctatus (strain DAOM BR117) TaxID=645134 RepID=A0A0L0HDY8_SPIPD|nr:uncharacterized protein SPPG_05046 [Spizellomyces punctatus DAOM BR117]KNC99665.1 hypothetical protein SPPG_05046 [Spizellomyces punctatus DAOM BR117]|eukprot:XP_016607705.1 hypothetical protein SPPG_05046 [Spizellomyces punctatus DAOM BR117]
MSVMGPTAPISLETLPAGSASPPTAPCPIPVPIPGLSSSGTLSGKDETNVKAECGSPQKKKLKLEGWEIDEEEPLVEDVAPAAEAEILVQGSPSHSVSWTVAAEKGYRKTFGESFPFDGRGRTPIHLELEDVHWPTQEDQVTGTKAKPTTTSGAHVFVLADGHGGVEAPRFFVGGATRVVRSLLESRSWEFDKEEDRVAFRTEIHTAFQILDASYASRKVEEYRRWMDAGSDGKARPVDDGCTLLVNVILNGWICNINVGDSRTVVGARRSAEEEAEAEAASLAFGLPPWTPVFSSSDHNMTHPVKIHHINSTGGQFVYPYGTLRTKSVQSTPCPPSRPYTELVGMRIYRPPTPQIRAVGVSHRRTLNLSATMGDLLFKVEPAVLSCIPDVEFIKLEKHRNYVVVAATDGVWDHMKIQNTEKQNEIIVDCVGGWLDGKWDQLSIQRESKTTSGMLADGIVNNSDPDSPSTLAGDSPFEEECDDPPQTMAPPSPSPLPPHRRLHLASRILVERERPEGLAALGSDGVCIHPDLYFPGQVRYDDATAYIIHLRGQL